MRVIAGRFGGRRLSTPPGRETRPTSDRVREALFSVLGDAVEGAMVLDLFAGSGALGIEALSRGAGQATFVDSSPAAVKAIRSNLETLGVEGSVQRADVRAAIRTARAAARQYDLIFLDPPYRLAASLAPGLSEAIGVLVAPGGRVVTESDRRAPLELDLPLQDERRYGDTIIRIHGA